MVTDDDAAVPHQSDASVSPFRRWFKMTIVLLSILALLCAAGVAGIGWYFSSQVIEVVHDDPDFPLEVLAVDADAGEVTVTRDDASARDGVWGLDFDGGRALLGEVRRSDADTVTRQLQETQGALPRVGQSARIDTWAYGEDPKSALDVDYADVRIPGPLGEMPAWHVPADGDVWVVAVHGRNAEPRETLRMLPTVHRQGLPMLAVTYRNDQGAPPAPDERHHLGDTEWEDVAAAVDYARDQGAAGVVLAGWSMGGAVAMTTLRRMDDPDYVRGVMLDSPVVDWSATLDTQGGVRGVPGFIVEAAKFLVQRRVDVDFDELDQVAYAPKLTTPVLLFADRLDDATDYAVYEEFFAAAPSDMITMVTTEAGHTASWNADPDVYDAAVAEFLRKRA